MRAAPRTQLIALFALTGTGLFALAGWQALDAAVVWWGFAGFAAVAAADMFISRESGISVVFPDIVRMAKNRKITFPVTVSGPEPSLVKIGFLLPGNRFAFPHEQEARLTEEARPAEKAVSVSIQWPVTGVKQGQFILDACHVETASRLGFWAVRRRIPLQCEFRVYPDMMPERRALAALFPESGFGLHARKSVGKGREFERLREYLPGDNYEDIHWKATARRGIPVSKMYQIERTQDVYVLIDAARMSARNARAFSGPGEDLSDDKRTKESILEKYITAALSVGMAAEHQGDNFGVGVFSDRMERFIPAGNSKAHYTACRDALYTIEPRKVTPDFTECITFAGNRIRKRSLLIIMTTLDDAAIADSLLNNIHILSRRHLVTVNMLRPVTARPLFSSEDISSVDDIYRSLGGHYLWHFLRECEGALSKLGTGFFLHPYQAFTLNTISHYMTLKKRQVL